MSMPSHVTVYKSKPCFVWDCLCLGGFELLHCLCTSKSRYKQRMCCTPRVLKVGLQMTATCSRRSFLPAFCDWNRLKGWNAWRRMSPRTWIHEILALNSKVPVRAAFRDNKRRWNKASHMGVCATKLLGRILGTVVICPTTSNHHQRYWWWKILDNSQAVLFLLPLWLKQAVTNQFPTALETTNFGFFFWHQLRIPKPK